MFARKKNFIKKTKIPQRENDIKDRFNLPQNLSFNESDEGQREFSEWKAQKAEKSDEKAVTQATD